MTNRMPRLAAAVFAVLVGLATVNVATAHAEEDEPISTTCGAGTITECGKVQQQMCDWSIDFSYGGGWNITFRFSKTNCRSVGEVPIYKDRNASSSLSGSCNLLSPFLGMPAGSGCSLDDEM